MSEGAQKKPEKPRKFQAIRGTRDLLPPETALWNRVEQTAHEVFTTYGYGEIRPPVFEDFRSFSVPLVGKLILSTRKCIGWMIGWKVN